MSNNTCLITALLCSFTMSLLICTDNKSSCKTKGNIEQKPTLILYKYVWLIRVPLLRLFRNVTILTRTEDIEAFLLSLFLFILCHPTSLQIFAQWGKWRIDFCPLIISVSLVQIMICETSFKFREKIRVLF